MQKQEKIQYVITRLTYFYTYISVNNKLSFTDINILAEDFIKNLLNIIFELNLQNLNYEQKNYPGVDLGDLSKKVAFQVTTNKTQQKFIETYEKVFKDYKNIGRVADIFSERIYFFIIDEKKPSFQKKSLDKITKASYGRFCKEDVLDMSDIIDKIVKLYDVDYERFKKIYDLISNNINTLPYIPTDKEIFEEILNCFNRPAFIVGFRMECSLEDFDKAIKNTISLINTGKSDDGVMLKYNTRDINNEAIKKGLSEIVCGLNYLRKIFIEMKKKGQAVKCKCGNPDCKLIFNSDLNFCWMMNELREVILLYVDKLANSIGCNFNIFPEYMKNKTRRLDGEDLLSCMEAIYKFYDKRICICMSKI